MSGPLTLGDVDQRGRAGVGGHVGDQGDVGRGRASDQTGRPGARDGAPRAGAVPAGAGRGGEGHPGGQGVVDDDRAGGRGGSVVADRQRVADLLAGHGVPAVGLRDRQVHVDQGRGVVVVGVVGGVRIGRRRRHVRGVDDVADLVGVDVDRDLDGRAGPVGEPAGEGAGDVLPGGGAGPSRRHRGEAGVGQAGRQRVGDPHRRLGERRPEVVDLEAVGALLARDEVTRRGLLDREVGLLARGARHRVGVVGGHRVGGRTVDVGGVGDVGDAIGVDMDDEA